MSKPLTTIDIYYREPFDPETRHRICTVEIPVIGKATINLTKNEMGGIVHEGSTVDTNEEFRATREDFRQVITELRNSMAQVQLDVNKVFSELFGLQKFLRE